MLYIPSKKYYILYKYCKNIKQFIYILYNCIHFYFRYFYIYLKGYATITLSYNSVRKVSLESSKYVCILDRWTHGQLDRPQLCLCDVSTIYIHICILYYIL